MSLNAYPFFLTAYFKDGAKVELPGSHKSQAHADIAAGEYIAHHRPLMPGLEVAYVAVSDRRLMEGVAA